MDDKATKGCVILLAFALILGALGFIWGVKTFAIGLLIIGIWILVGVLVGD